MAVLYNRLLGPMTFVPGMAWEGSPIRSPESAFTDSRLCHGREALAPWVKEEVERGNMIIVSPWGRVAGTIKLPVTMLPLVQHQCGWNSLFTITSNYVYMCVYTHVHICVCVCTYTYISTSTYIHTCVYVYTHTQTR